MYILYIHIAFHRKSVSGKVGMTLFNYYWKILSALIEPTKLKMHVAYCKCPL